MRKDLFFGPLQDRISRCLILLTMLLSAGAWGQVSITTSPQTYSQDFNSLSTTATAFANGSTLSGWYISSATLPVSDGSVSSPSNSCYNYGPSSNADRSIGALSSSSTAHRFGVRFKNNTGAAITSVTIGYTGEQWRQNSAAQTPSIIGLVPQLTVIG